MKYFISILILAAISYFTPIFGQSTLAIRGGVNLTNLGGNIVHSNNPRRSIKMGASVTLPIQDRWFSLQFASDYVPKGGKDNSSFDNLELNIDYLEFSALTVIRLLSFRRASSLSILAGPTVAFKVRNEGEDPIARRYRKDRFELKTLDFGIAGGMGIEMPFSEAMTVKAELLYTEGIRSINKTVVYNPNYSEKDAAGMTNRAIFFQIGLGFPYGRRN